MSECVVRMEMPQDCWFCPNGHPDWIYNDDGAAQMVCFCNICNTEEDNRWISETEIVRPSWCPIICQLHEGHGRLIDAHELFYNMFVMEDGRVLPNYDCDNFHIDMHVKDIKLRILETTTIVPAERSET